MIDPPSPETAFERHLRQTFTSVQLVLVYIVALFLILFPLLTLFNTGEELLLAIQQHQDLTQAVSKGVDAVLFAVILLEVLNTVLSRAAMVQKLQEFLVIAIFSAVRYGLEIVAGSQRAKVENLAASADGPLSSRDIVIDLSINSGGVLILVLALWFVKNHVSSSGTLMKPQQGMQDDDAR